MTNKNTIEHVIEMIDEMEKSCPNCGKVIDDKDRSHEGSLACNNCDYFYGDWQYSWEDIGRNSILTDLKEKLQAKLDEYEQ